MMMKYLKSSCPNQWRWIAALLITVSTTGFAQDTAAVSIEEAQAAQDAANAWIALIDSLDYAASWQQAAPYFQEQVSEAEWTQQLQSGHGSLGPLVSRTPQDREYSTALPNAPEGEYVIVTYASAYTQLENAMETVTMMKSDDDTWRAVGYFVRPGP